jgi:aryl-alcohol dehydrogenase-like predicted oxidoreductase
MNNKMWLGTELFNGSFGKKFTQKSVSTIISYASEIGLNKIDTAECYGVEELLGNAINNKRKDFKIATKFGHVFKGHEKIHAFDLKSVKAQLDNSLKLLKTDYIDLYYFHSGSNHEFNDDLVWEYLIKMQKKGKIIDLGLSLQHSLVIDNDYMQLEMAKEIGISTVQTVLNIHSNQSLKHVIPYCKSESIKVLGRMPLAKGLLTGKYSENHQFEATDQRAKTDILNRKIINENRNFSAEKALRWCMNYVDEVVVGSKNIHQLKENFNAVNFK